MDNRLTENSRSPIPNTFVDMRPDDSPELAFPGIVDVPSTDEPLGTVPGDIDPTAVNYRSPFEIPKADKRGRKVATFGLALMVVTGVAELITLAAATSDAGNSVAATTQNIGRPQFDLDPSALAGEIRRQTGAAIFLRINEGGFIAGFALAVLGYAQLFLDKQTVFQQHIGEQLYVTADLITGSLIGKGNLRMRDNTNVNGDGNTLAVGDHARVDMRNVNIFKKVLDNSTRINNSTREVLERAHAEINKLPISPDDKTDVADDLGKLTEELQKEKPVASRAARLVNNIARIAPSVAVILKSATTILSLIGV